MHTVRSLWPLYLAAFLATFQLSLANISIPDLQRGLHASPAQLALVVGAFTAAFAAGLVAAGHLGDRHGRRRLFVVGLVALLLATLAAAVAPSIGVLLAIRVVQGVASAAMMPQILATIQAVLGGHERTIGVAIFSGASGVGTVAGQVVGGAVITLAPQGWGWRGAQVTGAIVTAIALTGARHVPDTRSDHPSRVDLPGSLLLGAALLSLVAALSLGPTSHWAWWDLGWVALSLVLFAVLVAHQRWAGRTGRAVVLPARVVGLPPVRDGMLMALLFFAGFGAFMYNYSLLTQRDLGLDALHSGLSIGLFALAFVAASIASPALVRRLGGRVMVLGTVLQLLAVAALAVVSLARIGHWVLWFQPIGILLGIGQALMFAPLVGTVMQAVPTDAAGLAGGLVTTAQQAGLGVGVAVLGGLFAQLSASGEPLVAFGVVGFVQIGLSALFGLLAGRLDLLARRGRRRLTPRRRNPQPGGGR